MLRVREVVLVLAERHRVDREKVWLAASAHDIAREMDDAELLVKARELGICFSLLEEAAPILLHGPIAAELLRGQGLADTEVYQAIYWHSTARRGMTVVEKVLFLADKLDPEKMEAAWRGGPIAFGTWEEVATFVTPCKRSQTDG